MSNIERSEKVIAKILSLAMDRGISHWQLEFEDLELDNEYAVHFFPCVEWLEAEGVIRVGQYARTLGGLATGTVVNPTLTSSGFALLGREVDMGEGARQLSESVKSVSEGHTGYAEAGNFTGGLLATFIKSMA